MSHNSGLRYKPVKIYSLYKIIKGIYFEKKKSHKKIGPMPISYVTTRD